MKKSTLSTLKTTPTAIRNQKTYELHALNRWRDHKAFPIRAPSLAQYVKDKENDGWKYRSVRSILYGLQLHPAHDEHWYKQVFQHQSVQQALKEFHLHEVEAARKMMLPRTKTTPAPAPPRLGRPRQRQRTTCCRVVKKGENKRGFVVTAATPAVSTSTTTTPVTAIATATTNSTNAAVKKKQQPKYKIRILPMRPIAVVIESPSSIPSM